MVSMYKNLQLLLKSVSFAIPYYSILASFTFWILIYTFVFFHKGFLPNNVILSVQTPEISFVSYHST